MLGGHLALYVAGTDTEGPLQIEVVRSTGLAVRVYDWTPANSHQPIPVNASEGYKRTIYPIGQTNLSNPVFVDPSTGLGLLLVLVQQRGGYLSGWSSGLHLVRDLAMIVGQPRDPRFFHRFHLMEQYERLPPLLAQQSLPLLLERVGTWGDNSTNTFVQFRTDQTQNSTELGQGAAANSTNDALAGLFPPAGANMTLGGSAQSSGAATSNASAPLNGSAQLNGDTSFDTSVSLNGTSNYDWLLRLLDDVANAPSNGTILPVLSSGATYGVPVSPAPRLSPDSASSPSGPPVGRRLLLDPWQQAASSESPRALPSIVRRQQPPPGGPPNNTPLNLWEGQDRMRQAWNPITNDMMRDVQRHREFVAIERTTYSLSERQALLRQVQALPDGLGNALMESFRNLPDGPQEIILREVGAMPAAPQAALLQRLARLPPTARTQVLTRLQYMLAAERNVAYYQMVDARPPADPPARMGAGRAPFRPPRQSPPAPLEEPSPFFNSRPSAEVESMAAAERAGLVSASSDLDSPRLPPLERRDAFIPEAMSPPDSPRPGLSQPGSQSGGSSEAEPASRGGSRGGGPENCGRSLSRRAACGSRGGSTAEESRALLPDQKQLSLAYQSEPEPQRSIVLVKTPGQFSVIETVAADAGAALTVLGIAFVVVDFVNGNYVGGAVGLGSMVAGVALAAVATGPIGWILSGMAALFTVLAHTAAGIAEKDLAQRNNATQIIRYAFFGKDVTGNENCQAGRRGENGQPDVPPSPNCQVTYAPGILKSAFGWDNIDTAAFMLKFNDGYPMTIPAIADAFYLLQGNADDANRVATIKCSDYLPPCRVIDNNCPANDNTVCNDAVFGLNKDLVTLSPWNMTANQLRAKVAAGECRLDFGVSTYFYADYPLTVTGNPVALSCNVGSANSSTTTDANTHFVSAPPAQGFAPSINNATAVCLVVDAGKQLCLPSGAYAPQTGATGPLDTSQTMALTMPAGGWLKVQGQTFASNLTAEANDQTSVEFRRLLETPGDGFETHVPDAVEQASVCLFTDKNYKGDVACFGLGGGDVPDNVKGKARSLSLHAGASAWLFADHYNDTGGVQVTQSASDLEQIARGLEQNFGSVVKAMWVVR